MSEFNKQQFLESLPEEIRAKLEAAATNDEMLALADENDVELPAEALSGVAGSGYDARYNRNGEIEISIGGNTWYTKQAYRALMWGIYNNGGYARTLDFLNSIMATAYNKTWLDGSVDFYVDCIFSKMSKLLNGDTDWMETYRMI